MLDDQVLGEKIDLVSRNKCFETKGVFTGRNQNPFGATQQHLLRSTDEKIGSKEILNGSVVKNLSFLEIKEAVGKTSQVRGNLGREKNRTPSILEEIAFEHICKCLSRNEIKPGGWLIKKEIARLMAESQGKLKFDFRS